MMRVNPHAYTFQLMDNGFSKDLNVRRFKLKPFNRIRLVYFEVIYVRNHFVNT